MLRALSDLAGVGVTTPPRAQVMFLAQYSNPKSAGWVRAITELSAQSLIFYPSPGHVALTAEGWKVAPRSAPVTSSADLHHRIYELLDSVSERMLRILIEHHPMPVAREQLMSASGYSNQKSAGFVNGLSKLRALGFVEAFAPGEVRATDLLFIERAGA